MIKTIAELKDLIVFARENKLKSLKVGDIALEVSELAHIDTAQGIDMGTGLNKAVTASIGGLFDEQAPDEDDEDLLFHSSRP
jgi:hypothetical protein